jgi:hypothetical protein
MWDNVAQSLFLASRYHSCIPNEGLLPVFLMSVMTIACGGQVTLDITCNSKVP